MFHMSLPNQLSDTPHPDVHALVSSEQVHPQLRLDWYCNRQIVVYSISGDLASPPYIDIWHDIVAGIMCSWPKNKTYFGIHDITDADLSLTPYLRDKSGELFQLYRDLKQYVGIVVSNAFSAQMVRVLTRAYARDTLYPEVFSTRAEGLAWAKDALEQLSVPVHVATNKS